MAVVSYDVIIVGAGVVGCLIARELSRYRLRVLLLDKASDVGEGTTKANTAIVHAGYDAAPGSLKARLNVAGQRMFDDLHAELDIDFERCGTYVVGLEKGDRGTLHWLRERGVQNGVGGLDLIDGAEMLRREPSINSQTVGALHASEGGIVDPFDLCIGAAENAVMNGVELQLDTKALRLVREGDTIQGVETSAGVLRSQWTIIAAGLWSDELLHSAGLDGFEIRPRKGEYFVLDHQASEEVHHVLFPCPTPISKGILVTRTIHGNVMLGPNAQSVEDRGDTATTAAGLDEVMTGALRLVPSLDSRQVIRTFAGLRASSNRQDFTIEIAAGVRGLVAVGGIDSPGLSASPAIARYAVDQLAEAGLALQERSDYNPLRRRLPRFAELGRAERAALIARDPRYGHIICRCETVTEGEIVAACHQPVPARTYDGLKRRVRVGTGRCQGAFDTPLVIKIMARELGLSPMQITKSGGASRFLYRGTKDVCP